MNLQNIFGGILSLLKSPAATDVEGTVKSALSGIVASNPEVAAAPGAIKALASVLTVAAQIDPAAQPIVEPAENFLAECENFFASI